MVIPSFMMRGGYPQKEMARIPIICSAKKTNNEQDLIFLIYVINSAANVASFVLII